MLICRGDARAIPLPDQRVQCVVTSPPYWGLRAYKGVGERGIGLEKTPEEYVANLVEVFREVRRVLRDDGTVWLNLGDCYYTTPRGNRPGDFSTSALTNPKRQDDMDRGNASPKQATNVGSLHAGPNRTHVQKGLKHKDLLGLPWLVAFALRADGWYLRSDIIWAKGVSFRPEFSGSVMPESVTDRPTRAHEYLFLLTKRERYYWNRVAAKEKGVYGPGTKAAKGSGTREGNRRGGNAKNLTTALTANQARLVARTKVARAAGIAHDVGVASVGDGYATYSGLRNLRDVWAIGTRPYTEAHFATFPPGLVYPCLSIGSSPYACASCGAGWTQVLDQEPVPDAVRAQFEAARAATVAGTGRTDGHTQRKPNYHRQVEGAHWEPTCRCGTQETQYQIVLDPFGGSGTVGEVAQALGRYAVLVDASYEYCQLARRRCGLDAPPDLKEEAVV